MIKPIANAEPEYVDKDVRVRFRIIDDNRLELRVKNLTGRDARIFWKNSSFAAIDSDEAEMGVYFVDSDDPKPPAVSTIGPHGTLTVEVYPMYNAFVDDKGLPGNRPLYVNAEGEGAPEDLAGKQIGLNLVIELNGSSRFHRFRMEVTPSPPEKN